MKARTKIAKGALPATARPARFTIEVSADLAREIIELQRTLRMDHKKDVFCTAIEVMLWMVKKRLDGKNLVAINPETGQASELSFVGLERISSTNSAGRLAAN